MLEDEDNEGSDKGDSEDIEIEKRNTAQPYKIKFFNFYSFYSNDSCKSVEVV